MGMKLEGLIADKRRFAREIRAGAVKTVRNVVRVLRIMIFLHFARDFSSVLKFHGVDDSSVRD
jgi:hypothetical protein